MRRSLYTQFLHRRLRRGARHLLNDLILRPRHPQRRKYTRTVAPTLPLRQARSLQPHRALRIPLRRPLARALDVRTHARVHHGLRRALRLLLRRVQRAHHPLRRADIGVR